MAKIITYGNFPINYKDAYDEINFPTILYHTIKTAKIIQKSSQRWI